MPEVTEWKQERPTWCHHKDCIFLRRAMDSFCGGKLPVPIKHNKGLNTHRFCLNEEVFGITDYMVNDNDLQWIRWIFDALDGLKTSWLSKDR